MNDYTFGNFLCSLRTEKGLSQSQLGEMLGVTNKAVSKWENGVAKPNTSLLPKIAEIFDITVEELFASRRIERNDELERIKIMLSKQKKKYANLVSVFLALLITVPLLLIEFICVVMGFNLSDEIVGPIGAMLFIISYPVCIAAFIIYKSNLKGCLIGDKEEFMPKWTAVNRALLSFVISILVLITIISIHPVLLVAYNPNGVYVSLSICFFIVILLAGGIIYFLNLRRIYNYKYNQSDDVNNEKNIKFSFSKLPLGLKAFHILCYILLSVSFIIIIDSFINGFEPLKNLVVHISVIISSVFNIISRKHR